MDVSTVLPPIKAIEVKGTKIKSHIAHVNDLRLNSGWHMRRLDVAIQNQQVRFARIVASDTVNDWSSKHAVTRFVDITAKEFQLSALAGTLQ